MLQPTEQAVAQHGGQLELHPHFVTPIYVSYRPDFLPSVRKASIESLDVVRKIRPNNDMNPSVMSEDLMGNPALDSFSEYAGMSAWNILSEQGYQMQDFRVQFSELWAQEHHKYSSMDQHIHGLGAQIVGFYFMDVPEKSSNAVFHDTRSGCLQGNLPRFPTNEVKISSNAVNYEPEPGMFIFTNAWLAHSFTKHASESPLRFIHFNLIAAPVTQQGLPKVEVI